MGLQDTELCKALQSGRDQRAGTSQGSLLLTNKAHTQVRGAGQKGRFWLSLCPFKRGEGRREREGKVPSCPGTEGRYKACSSSGPSRQAGWLAGRPPSFNVSVAIPKAR